MRLPIPPDQTGYVLTEGKEILSVALAGGPSRYRRDTVGASCKLQALWILDPNEFETLRSFYKSTRYNNAAWFDADLLVDQPYISSYKASFIPGSFQLKSQYGLTYEVTADLEVISDIVNNASWMNPDIQKLSIPVQQKGFESKDYEETLSVIFDGGRSLFRRGPSSPLSHIVASWSLVSNEYFYLRNFYRTTLINGSFPFLVDIIYDSGLTEECLAYFIPGTFKLAQIEGSRYIVNCELETYKRGVSELFDIIISGLEEIYGTQDEVLTIFGQLEDVTQTWPLAS